MTLTWQENRNYLPNNKESSLKSTSEVSTSLAALLPSSLIRTLWLCFGYIARPIAVLLLGVFGWSTDSLLYQPVQSALKPAVTVEETRDGSTASPVSCSSSTSSASSTRCLVSPLPSPILSNPLGYRVPADTVLASTEVWIETVDRIVLHGWLLRHPKSDSLPHPRRDLALPAAPRARPHASTPLLVYLHGNAGNVGLRAPQLRALALGAGADVLCVDYRGYGLSGLRAEGTPAAVQLHADDTAGVGGGEVTYAREWRVPLREPTPPSREGLLRDVDAVLRWVVGSSARAPRDCRCGLAARPALPLPGGDQPSGCAACRGAQGPAGDRWRVYERYPCCPHDSIHCPVARVGAAADGAGVRVVCTPPLCLDPARVVVMGTSLGGAVAAALAASELGRLCVRAAVVENALASVGGVAEGFVPLLGGVAAVVDAVVASPWNTLVAASKAACPLLVLSGARDRLVPASHSDAVFCAAARRRSRRGTHGCVGACGDTGARAGARSIGVGTLRSRRGAGGHGEFASSTGGVMDTMDTRMRVWGAAALCGSACMDWCAYLPGTEVDAGSDVARGVVGLRDTCNRFTCHTQSDQRQWQHLRVADAVESQVRAPSSSVQRLDTLAWLLRARELVGEEADEAEAAEEGEEDGVVGPVRMLRVGGLGHEHGSEAWVAMGRGEDAEEEGGCPLTVLVRVHMGGHNELAAAQMGFYFAHLRRFIHAVGAGEPREWVEQEECSGALAQAMARKAAAMKSTGSGYCDVTGCIADCDE